MAERRRKKVWVGFSDGRPAYTVIDTGFGGWGKSCERTIVIFTNKSRAKRQYDDVRQMELLSMPRKRRVLRRQHGDSQ